MQLEEAQKRIKALENELEQKEVEFAKEKDRLLKLIVSWKRKVEDKGIHRESLKEGYNAVTGMHYKTYEISLPGDLNITAVLDYLKENDLKDLYPYRFSRIDYNPKKKSWVYCIEKALDYDILLDEKFLFDYYNNLYKN